LQHSASARTATASLHMVAGKLVAKLIDFATLLVLTSLLQPSDFGLVAMGMTVVLMVEGVLELPLAQALLRIPNASASAYDTAFTLSLLRGLLMATLIAALARPLAGFYGEPRLVGLMSALAVGPALRGLISPRLVDYQRQLDFRWNAAMEVIGKIMAFVGASLLAIATRSYWALAVASIITSSAMTVVSYIIAPHRPRLRLTHVPDFANMMGWHSLSQLVTSLNWQVDKFFIGRWADSVSLGQFFMAENVASIPNNAIVGPLSRPLMAAYAPLRTQSALKVAYCRASSAVFLLGTPPLVVLALLAQPLMRIAFNPKWLAAAPLLHMLAFANVLALPTEPLAGLAMALNKTRVLTWRSSADFVVRIPVTILAVLYFGVTGAVWARLFANAACMSFSMLILTRLIGVSVREQLQVLARPCAAIAALMVPLLMLEPLLARVPAGLPLIAATMGVAGTAATAYLGVAWVAWHVAGRPAGVEALIMARFDQVRHALRAAR
jgi:O-antigen/teichoic acid export membrane protein